MKTQKPVLPEGLPEMEKPIDPIKSFEDSLEEVKEGEGFGPAPTPGLPRGAKSASDLEFDPGSMAKLFEGKIPSPPRQAPPEQQAPAPPPANKIRAPGPKVTGDAYTNLLPMSLVEALERDFGYREEKLYSIDCFVEDKVLNFKVRKPIQDDFMWAQAVLVDRLLSNRLRATDEETTRAMIKQLVACRCVVEIFGSPVFDGARTVIFKLKPAWDGSYGGIPEDIKAALGIQVYNMLIESHPNILFGLDAGVENLVNTGKTSPDEVPDPELEAIANPTLAP